jgi:hypothetical protein
LFIEKTKDIQLLMPDSFDKGDIGIGMIDDSILHPLWQIRSVLLDLHQVLFCPRDQGILSSAIGLLK